MSRIDDIALWQRANAYAHRIKAEAATVTGGGGLDSVDVARAFVIGYAAGVEAAQNHRAVRK